MCIDCCAKLNQYFDFFETSSRAQLSLQILFDPKLVASSKKEPKKEPELEPEPEHHPKLETLELPICQPKTKEEENDDDDDDEDDDDEDDDDDDIDNDPAPGCAVADLVCEPSWDDTCFPN